MKILLLVVIGAFANAQSLPDVLKQGEAVFNKSCATGYCHGARGTTGGAPRLAARGFDQNFINDTVARGVPSTAMPAFGTTLSRADLTAVVAYVASLNGVANPVIAGSGPAGPPAVRLSAEAARGRDLFSDSVRSFGRCSTCHEVAGIGIPVATPIAKIPADAAALKALATPQVSTAMVGSESMPGSHGQQEGRRRDLLRSDHRAARCSGPKRRVRSDSRRQHVAPLVCHRLL